MFSLVLQCLDDKIPAFWGRRHGAETQTNVDSNPALAICCLCDLSFSALPENVENMRVDTEILTHVIQRGQTRLSSDWGGKDLRMKPWAASVPKRQLRKGDWQRGLRRGQWPGRETRSSECSLTNLAGDIRTQKVPLICHFDPRSHGSRVCSGSRWWVKILPLLFQHKSTECQLYTRQSPSVLQSLVQEVSPLETSGFTAISTAALYTHRVSPPDNNVGLLHDLEWATWSLQA